MGPLEADKKDWYLYLIGLFFNCKFLHAFVV